MVDKSIFVARSNAIKRKILKKKVFHQTHQLLDTFLRHIKIISLVFLVIFFFFSKYFYLQNFSFHLHERASKSEKKKSEMNEGR